MTERPNKFTGGFTIVELLISLAIAALLLAAIAVAFNASVINYRENEDIFKTINNTRQALSRITTDLRTGHSFKLDDPDYKCTFFTAGNKDITYEYRIANNNLYLITNSDNQEYLLCDNVSSMSFIKTLTDEGTDVKSVQISMTVFSGNIQRTISAAAVVRKNLK